jgi:hypothetical protein
VSGGRRARVNSFVSMLDCKLEQAPKRKGRGKNGRRGGAGEGREKGRCTGREKWRGKWRGGLFHNEDGANSLLQAKSRHWMTSTKHRWPKHHACYGMR